MKVRVLFGMILWLVLTPHFASAEKWIIACDKHYPPYNWEEDGEAVGLDVDIVKAVMAYLKEDYDIVFLPWQRAEQMTYRNEVDMAFVVKWTLERSENFYVVGPVRTGKTVIVTTRDSGIETFSNLSDLKRYTVGHVRGYVYTEEFDRTDFRSKDQAVDTKQLLKKLIAKRNQIIIGDWDSLVFEAKIQGVYGQIYVIPRVLKEFPRYVIFPRSRARQAVRFENAFNALKETGVMDEIVARWR